MNTRLERISAYMAATSAQYRNAWVGLKVVYTTDEGKRLKGIIAGWAHNQAVAILTNGAVVKLKAQVEIVP